MALRFTKTPNPPQQYQCLTGAEPVLLFNSGQKRPACRQLRRRRTRRVLREPVSVNSRTGLRHAEMEIGKWRGETGARNPPRKDLNTKNRPSETGARQPNPGECGRLPGWGGRIRTRLPLLSPVYPCYFEKPGHFLVFPGPSSVKMLPDFVIFQSI